MFPLLCSSSSFRTRNKIKGETILPLHLPPRWHHRHLVVVVTVANLRGRVACSSNQVIHALHHVPLFGPAGYLPIEGQAQALGPRCTILDLEYGSCSGNSTLCSVSFRQLQPHRGQFRCMKVYLWKGTDGPSPSQRPKSRWGYFHWWCRWTPPQVSVKPQPHVTCISLTTAVLSTSSTSRM